MANGKTVKRILASLAIKFAEDPTNTFDLDVFFRTASEELGEVTATELREFHTQLTARRDAVLALSATNPRRDGAITAFGRWLHEECGMVEISGIMHLVRLIDARTPANAA